MRSCSCCFCVLSSFARFSMARFSHQREKKIHPTTNTMTTRAAEVYSVGFLKKGLDCVSGSAGMVTPRTKQLPLKKYRKRRSKEIVACGRPFEFTFWRQRDFDFFTSQEFRQLLAAQSIKLVSWREIAATDQLDALRGEQLTKFLA